MKTKQFSILVVFVLLITASKGQIAYTPADYRKADSITGLFNEKVFYIVDRVNWVKDQHSFWYKTHTKQGTEYYLVDASKLSKTTVFDPLKLASELKKFTGKDYKPFDIPIEELAFSADLKTITFQIDTAKWEWNRLKNILKYTGKVVPEKEEDYWGSYDYGRTGKPAVSPDKKWTAFIKNYNLFIKDAITGKEFQLSYDGSDGEYYSWDIAWSPNSRKIAVNRIRGYSKHIIYFVESSPVDQLQPKLHQRDYLKPGDALPIIMPCLFDIDSKSQINADVKSYLNQYSLEFTGWRKDSRAFTFEFNERGHQRYMVVEVNADNGAQTVLVDEKSDTFIEYSSPNKKIRSDINDGKELIWASERDGWNHLYLYDNTGRVINQITKGEWVVRGVEWVDEKTRQIIFRASGRNVNEDPYLIHLYRINFDGTGLTELSPEEANHRTNFSTDFSFFTDSYSRIDLPPTLVLRNASDGKILMKLEEANIDKLIEFGWKTPEVFTAKGRDGKTDIWGMIYRPSSFDPDKKYPIIEYIYAGPHDSFVPKSFIANYRWFSGLAELGFIVVQIDGMGTSNRSKAFHDVCWRNIKDSGFPDRIEWIKAAAKKYSYMDTSRIGIFGGSAGGQSSTAALLFHPEFYKVAVSACGCHDNRMDKIWWNEQWMGYPVGPWYAENSNVVNAYRLKGKLLLIVGEVDDNVDPASTMQVCDALIKANKEFELLVLPGVNHTLGGFYGERKRRDFFIKNLLNATTPDWNKNE